MDAAEEFVDDFLEHHGVKGMKWGVHRSITRSRAFKSWSRISKKNVDAHHRRKSARTARKKEEAKEKAAASKAKAAAKAEKKQKRAERAERWRKESEERDFRTTANSPEFKANLNRSVGKALVEDGGPVSQINQKYATYRASGSLKDPNHPATKKYNDEVADAYIKEANKQLSSTTDISGSLKLTAVRRKPGLWDDPNKFEYDIEVEEVKHADDIYYEIRLVPDSNGEIVDFEMIDDVLEQGELFVDDILAHHGVKGMKWGVRNTDRSSGTGGSSRGPSRKERRAAKRIAKADARLEKTIASKRRSNQLKVQLHNSIGPVVQSKVNRLNNKPEYLKAAQNGSFKDPNSPATKKYLKEYNKIYMDEMNDYLKGYSSASGKRVVKAEINQEDFLGFSLRMADAPGVKHADPLVMKFEYIKDENGVITGLKLVDDEMTQGEMAVGHILEHHGIKGMKWGVRRNKPSAVTVSQNPKHLIKRERLKTKGGYGREASEDAIRARTAGQVAKKSGVQALSNAELNDYVNRVNLEQRAKRAQYDDASPPVKFVKTLLRQQGSAIVNETAKDVGSHQVRKRLVKAGLLVPSKAMKAAMAAA